MFWLGFFCIYLEYSFMSAAHMGGLSIGFVDLFPPAQFHSRATVLSKSHMETAAHLHGQSELANVSPDS